MFTLNFQFIYGEGTVSENTIYPVYYTCQINKHLFKLRPLEKICGAQKYLKGLIVNTVRVKVV